MAATPKKQFKNICVLSGFKYDKHKEFIEAVINLGRNIVERKLQLVYGGGNRRLSKLVSEAAFVRGSQVLGIIPRALKPLGSLFDSSTRKELIVSGMQERITEMLNHADACIFLPEDLVTLEALIILASWAHLHIHQKPIAKKLFICAHTVNELLDLLQAYRPKPDPWTFVLERPNNDGNSSRSKKAYVHIHKDDRSKLDGKAKECIFLGYGHKEFGFSTLVYDDHEGAGEDNNDGLVELVKQAPTEPLALPVESELRRSTREWQPSTRYPPNEYVMLIDGGEPECFEETMKFLNENHIYDLVKLLKGNRALKNKWAILSLVPSIAPQVRNKRKRSEEFLMLQYLVVW
ncbi:hypothetical protein WN943_014511 [Citrus x changshan-huyou]